MEIVFETTDKTGKIIHLTKERLKHIQKHPHMQDPLDYIEITLKEPITIRYFEDDTSIRYFYKKFKERPIIERFLLVSIKYLNSTGFIITSFFTNRISGSKWI